MYLAKQCAFAAIGGRQLTNAAAAAFLSATSHERFNSTAAAAAAPSLSDELAKAKAFEEIPGPNPIPILGNTWRFFPLIASESKEIISESPSGVKHNGDIKFIDFVQLHKDLHERYGDIIRLSHVHGRKNAVILHNPDDIEKVFRNEGPWPIRDGIGSIEYYRNVLRKDIFQGVGGALTVQGPEWQKFRSKVNQPMMQPRTTKLYVGPIDVVASDFIKRIRLLRDEKQEMPEYFLNEMYKWALESIVAISLDTRLGCLDADLEPDSEPQKMINAVQVIFDSMYKLDMQISFWKLISTPAWRRFVKAADYFTEVAMKYISKAMEKVKDMPAKSTHELTVLERLLASDPDPKTAVVMALDMMTAGIDTTSYSTAVALYHLSKNQNKQEKLFQEVNRFLPDPDTPVTSEILNELKYLKACIKESMRITPIAIGNMRELVKDLVLSGYRIPKGTDVVMPLILLSNDEKYFPQADKYIPERWLKDQPSEITKKGHSFVFLPFGFGPRMCLGRRFAELELETILAKMVRNFHIEYNYGEMKMSSKILYTPASPLKFKLEDRA